ncbi:MAG: tryptophan--tRNA ligase, partial [Rhodospirillaceae bacterium]|nr:tryptophan--tRNA ligase [Rhodospirillaceae bacterium]
EYSRINLADDADTIAKKIRKARTDADPLPASPDGLAERPEARNLVGIYAALSGQSTQEVCAQFAGKQFSEFKADMADLAVAALGPIGERMNRLQDDPGYIDDVLRRGAEKASALAEVTLKEVKDMTGLLQP